MEAKQAIDEYIGEQFIEWLWEHINSQVTSWPILAKIAQANSLKPEKIRKLMLQIFLAKDAFLGSREGDPGFLRFAIANLSESDEPVAESALEILENLRQVELAGHRLERGILQTTHREAWVNLLKTLGVTDVEINRAEPKEHTRNYIAELSDIYSNSEWSEAIGAFAAYPRIDNLIDTKLAEMLKRNFSLSEKDLSVLHVSQRLGATARLLDKVAFDRENKDLVLAGVTKALVTTQEFVQGLEKYLEA